ncbi:hypothetical protein [Streptomyces sp. CBMA29]|uniref:hypothetical protein n=1 Tax=Streptomyces sp. CBMA29 TaxID=1896314 RepID=UPI0016618B29|nr:hypothetical protein [Streptomyces sp. CBMA29]MBD0733998.1 hypothetical protein [Streptomyces sp. CBMA29]
MDVKQRLTSAELVKLVGWVTGGDYSLDPNIVDGSGVSIGTLPAFEAYEEVEEGAWPQRDEQDGVDYLAMVALQENGDAVYEAIEEHGEDVVRMTAQLIREQKVEPIHVSGLDAFIKDNYRQRFDSPGEFAQHHMRGHEGGAWDAKTLDEVSGWVDWEGYADSPNMSDFTFLKPEGVGEDQHGPVYVFDADPEIRGKG